jgi:translation initiation factor 2 beta subunit (eIF-2beta)/eIF-5
MEATYKTANGRLMIKVEAESQKDLFKQIAQAQDVFDAQGACGECESASIRLRVRHHEKGDYYEMVCNACGAQFSFGQHKTGGTLFPKHELGWKIYKAGEEGQF